MHSQLLRGTGKAVLLAVGLGSLAACAADGENAERAQSAIEEGTPDAADAGNVDAAAPAPSVPSNPVLDPSSSPDAGLGGTDDDGLDRDVLRPESREPTEERIRSLRLPRGFAIDVFARDLKNARMLAVNGPHVYLTRREQGDVLLLEDTDRDGQVDRQRTVASGLHLVHGVTVHAPYLYLATDTQVYRASLLEDGTLGTPVPIIDDLPNAGQHPNRTLAVGPDDKLYITVGSACDACPLDDPEYATILRAELDGARREIVASGLRNTIGFGWHPETGALWGLDHGSDWRGDDTPPEELNEIEQGKHYGWPYCWGDRQIDTIIQKPPTTTKEAFCAMTTPPVLKNQAHEAPIGMTFYTASQFPEAYKNSAFVAFRGSWNRIPATGYKVGRVVFEGGRPVRIEDFVSGFLIEDGKAQFGRLAGIAVTDDGSLLFTDDENGVIYRVSYAGP